MTNHTSNITDTTPVLLDSAVRHLGSRVTGRVLGQANRRGLGDLDGRWLWVEMDDTLERIWIPTWDLELI